MRDLKYIQPWDTIIFDSLETLNNREIDKSKLIDNYGKFIWKNYTTIKIKDEWNLADLEYLFEHLDLKWYPTKIVFPEFTFGNYGWSYTKKAIKILKKFLLKTDRYGCYFDIWENIHTWWYSDKNNYLKDLITRFTKQWKSWKLRDCVIKANWKEYHCSWDYRYDFE